MAFTFCRLGDHVLFVLMLEWLAWFPVTTPLPQILHLAIFPPPYKKPKAINPKSKPLLILAKSKIFSKK
jgi:hypothetical protein